MRGGKKHDLSRIKPYIPVRRAEAKTEIDRGTWAGGVVTTYDVLVKGAGEYLTEEPIYFGRAYEAPPHFTFSVVREGVTLNEVRAISSPPELVPQHAPIGIWTGKGSQLQRDNILGDGSFETQAAVWGSTYIPSITESEVNEHWTAYQQVFEANRSPGTMPSPGYVNHWIQRGPAASATPRWVLSNDTAYPDEFGYQGEWSAKYVFDSNPESPWLIPIRPQATYLPIWEVTGWTEDQIEMNIFTFLTTWSGSNSFQPEGGFLDIGLNPRLSKHSFMGRVWSDGPCRIEFLYRLAIDGPDEETGFMEVLDEQTAIVGVPPNSWTDAPFVCPMLPSVHPNIDEWWLDPDEISWNQATRIGDTVWALIKFRILDGTPGQVVYVDDWWGWPDVTTDPEALLTCGVAEWITDEADMYIGAKVWFKSGISYGGLDRPYGARVDSLPGGDFEDAINPILFLNRDLNTTSQMRYALDQQGTVQPLNQPFLQLPPSSPFSSFGNGAKTSGWFITSTGSSRAPMNTWVVSDIDPYDGGKHLLFVEGGTDGTNLVGSETAQSIVWVNGFWLDRFPYSTAVNKNDTVNFSFRAKISAVTGSARNAELYIKSYDLFGSLVPAEVNGAVGSVNGLLSTVTLTTSYQLIQGSAKAYQLADFVLLQAVCRRGSNPTNSAVSYFMDAFTYSITPG